MSAVQVQVDVSDLDREMGALLLRLEMLSHGSTQAWNASGGGSGEPDDRMVSLVARGENPPHVRYRIMYERQHTDVGRRAVLDEARTEWERACRREKPPEEQRGGFEEWVLADGEGWPAEAVAERFNLHVAFVRRIRERAGREAELGRELGAADSIRTPADEALELSRQGLPQVQIAKRLGMSQSAVSRILKLNRFRPTRER